MSSWRIEHIPGLLKAAKESPSDAKELFDAIRYARDEVKHAVSADPWSPPNYKAALEIGKTVSHFAWSQSHWYNYNYIHPPHVQKLFYEFIKDLDWYIDRLRTKLAASPGQR